MSDQDMQDTGQDTQWTQLLTRAHGAEPDVRPGFKAELLAKLKAKTAQAAAADAPEADAAEDARWRTLLTAACPPCEPRPGFKAGLLAELKQQQRASLSAATEAPAGADEADAVRTLLAASYPPVAPRKEFETRLLENLKRRQRESQSTRSHYRRRTIYLSGLSSMAAAAMVMFVVWIMPGGKLEQPGGQGLILASGPVASAPVPAAPAERRAAAADVGDHLAVASLAVPAAAAAAGSYRVADAFAAAALPETVRGIGMQINDGDGWRGMDETTLARVEPGMQFRPAGSASRSGLGFSDGSTFLVFPEAVVTATENGFTVREGELAVTVPDNSDSRFRLHFPERDIAIEPGTMLTVAVPSPEGFAEGGAPAPVVKVLDGGMALAMGKSGAGPLLANQVYELDNYVTPDIPGRPLCAAETRELLQMMNPVGVEMAAAGGASFDGGMRLVSSASRPAERAATPEGFVKKGSRWQPASYRDQPTIRIRYLSDAYFGFASQRRDLADVLALGSDLILDGGDGHFYEIHR